MINNAPLPKTLKGLANLFTYLANLEELSNDVTMELESEIPCDIMLVISSNEVSFIVVADSEE